MSWPLISDFSRILQNPKVAFRNQLLRESVIELDNLGQPKARAGNFATVYRAYTADGRQKAIRVFNRRADERRERYQVVIKYVESRAVASLVGFEYDEKGIRSASDGQMYPLLTMEWVPGVTLLEWVRGRCREGYQEALAIGADVWLYLVRDLTTHEIVHGDLQHGNVLVSSEGHFKLVDYDCMGVPELMGHHAMELGLPPYQHPGRSAETVLFPGLDNFSALVIYVALRALAAAPGLWFTYVDNPGYDKMLFRVEDFANPNASPLYHELMNSPDEQVRDLTHYLFQLAGYELHTVPVIDEVLLWCNSLDDLLSQRDWDTAVELVTRMGPNEPIPIELQPLVSEAQRRVACRQALEAALDSGDEEAIDRCYDPQLLDDYPAAAHLVSQARVAGNVRTVLTVLDAAMRFQNWEIFKNTWLENQELLAERVSARPYQAEVQKILTGDSLRKLLANPNADDESIVDAWNYLESLGGHATVEPLRQQVEQRVARLRTVHEYEKLLSAAPNIPTIDYDRKLIGGWRKEFVEGWSRIEPLRQQYQAARGRLKRLARLKELTAQRTAEGEKEIVILARDLPASYHRDLAERVAKANARLQAYRTFRETLLKPRSDRAILKAHHRLKDVKAVDFLSDEEQWRVRLAKRRWPLIHAVRKLDPQTPPEQLDRELLTVWDERLLYGCHDLRDWAPLHAQAQERQQVIQRIQTAIADGDEQTIEELRNEPCLRSYQLPREITDAIAAVRQQIEQAIRSRHQALTTALLESDRIEFAEKFDAVMVREICEKYQHHRQLAAAWTESEILPRQRSGLEPHEEGGVQQIEPDKFQVRWKWPSRRITEKCRLALCRDRPKSLSDPDSGSPVYSIDLDRSQWESAGRCHTIEMDPDREGCHVYVWPIVDLGFQLFYGEPLEVGRLLAESKRRRWSLFSGE